MSEFVIEKGVEIPRRKAGRGRESKYPFAQMEPGDSFFAPGMRLQTVSTAARKIGLKKVPGSKWVTRSVEGGIRVWRVA